ncbi:dephospho-CoA kinase [Lampropedia puyangensis]|uniref:Dephospho-CoA kinase n=1 Tax=Lampropedia puyangensis TaxID=1330072 RepID=A0A4S8F092_9BURK|nr:dephospho-CoA kinase [Lampropedia puyangensis]THU00297.1 dephospho-CoA kinase [Lampropedia puyangensis]
MPCAPRHSHPPRLIGLTGGIGSGKSTVAQLLLQHTKAAIIDADQLSRALTAAGGAAIPLIAQAFGSSFITPEGALHREHMRAYVFHSPAEKKRLEGILHPMIFSTIEQAIKNASDQGHSHVVLDIPLLVESGHWRARLGQVVIIDCPVELQIRRVQQRSQLEQAEIERIIQSQASRQDRLASADVVIYNGDICLSALQTRTQAAAAFLGL